MDIYKFYTNNELLTLCETSRTEEYALLIRFLGDYITDFAVNAPEHEKEIKGMSMLLHKIKTLPYETKNILINRRKEGENGRE